MKITWHNKQRRFSVCRPYSKKLFSITDLISTVHELQGVEKFCSVEVENLWIYLYINAQHYICRTVPFSRILCAQSCVSAHRIKSLFNTHVYYSYLKSSTYIIWQARMCLLFVATRFKTFLKIIIQRRH
jgi:hypothetical protein